jgi:hypothetical protein
MLSHGIGKTFSVRCSEHSAPRGTATPLLEVAGRRVPPASWPIDPGQAHRNWRGTRRRSCCRTIESIHLGEYVAPPAQHSTRCALPVAASPAARALASNCAAAASLTSDHANAYRRQSELLYVRLEHVPYLLGPRFPAELPGSVRVAPLAPPSWTLGVDGK